MNGILSVSLSAPLAVRFNLLKDNRGVNNVIKAAFLVQVLPNTAPNVTKIICFTNLLALKNALLNTKE